MTQTNDFKFRASIADFMASVADEKLQIYNEFSLQHEIGIHLRHEFRPLQIQFERNISFFGFDKTNFEKREMDIVGFSSPDGDLKLAVELKFPRNGQYPEQMFSFCKDIMFLEQLHQAGFEDCYFIVVADDALFYEGTKTGIYSFFRGGQSLHGEISKPTGKKDKILTIRGHYDISWSPISGTRKYAVVHVV